MSKQRVVVGLSGGVDSAVSAWLLKQQGYEVIGLFMKNWEDEDDDEYCSTREDLIDATAVADVIGIDIEAVNFSSEYKDRVFAEFLAEYAAGRTPNPDVLCNAEIKFKAFLDHAMRLGAERIATGHYARIDRDDSGLYRLLKAKDASKDQSYFLHRLNQEQLSRALFPLGEMQKTEVRALAERIGLPNAKKKDSTGICFIGERPFRAFLNRYLPTQPGPILTPRFARPDDGEHGRLIGTHVGLAFYTLGQRKGIGIGGVSNVDGGEGDWGKQSATRQSESHEPLPEGAWFVAKKDMANNALWVVRGHDHPWLLSSLVDADHASWVAGHAPTAQALHAKTRYRQSDAACRVESRVESRIDSHTGFAGERFTLTFDEPQWAVTPGQSAVLYDGDVCLGGGIIAGTATTLLRDRSREQEQEQPHLLAAPAKAGVQCR